MGYYYFFYSLIAPLLVLAAGLGGVGLPLGMPPGPEDPVLARIAPEECLAYVSWAGMAEPNGDGDNHTERLLADPQVKAMAAEFERRIHTSLVRWADDENPALKPLATEAAAWVKAALTSPGAVFIGAPDESGFAPGGALFNLGPDAAKLLALLERHQRALLGEKVESVQISDRTWYRLKSPAEDAVVTWGVWSDYFVIAFGEGCVEQIVKRAETPPPAWLSDLRRRLPVPRTASVTYVNIEELVNFNAPPEDELAPPDEFGSPSPRTIIDAMGAGNIETAAIVTGLDEKGCVTRMAARLKGKPKGLLQFVPEKTLAPSDLAAIPADAELAVAGRVNADEVIEIIATIAGDIEPMSREMMLSVFEEMRVATGVDLRKDLLRPLGDRWCVYLSAAESGLMFNGVAAVARVEDRPRLAAAHKKLIDLAKAQAQGIDSSDARVSEFSFAGQTIYYFDARDDDFWIAPAWCLTEQEAVFGLYPQTIKAYLTRRADAPSLAEAPAVAEMFPDGAEPSLLAYVDTREAFQMLYPLALMGLEAWSAEMGEGGIDLDFSLLPSVDAVGRHLQPTATAIRRTPDGIEMISRQTFPGGVVGTAGAISAGTWAVYLRAGYEVGRLSASLNNLKQIGLALYQYNEAHGRFPPAYRTDKNGKPLLSWRVAILPYLDQDELYKSFHLDEPWNSPHNMRLVSMIPKVYQSPGSRARPGMTHYLAPRGKNTVFPGKDGIAMADIRGRKGETIIAVEVNNANAVAWSRPVDFDAGAKDPIAKLFWMRRRGFLTLRADGSCEDVPATIKIESLRAAFTRDGDEHVHDPFDD